MVNRFLLLCYERRNKNKQIKLHHHGLIMKRLLLSLFLISLPSFALDYGLDRLSEASVAEKLVGKNLAVLTHAAAVSKSGDHLIDLLFKSYSLKKIFAPEHGLRTVDDDYIENGIDEKTGLPVISLYKRGATSPRPEDLVGIDAIVVDLQDVGLRYYTYFATIAKVMIVAAPLNIEVIILDRPNLLGGDIIEGKTLDAKLTGNLTAYHTVPTRHGMTLGELAQMVNVEKKINVKLTVITASGWNRENQLDQTERKWIPPSPALVNISQVGLYAIWGSLENFNVAVGRGKTNELAFNVLGAPWITEVESIKLAEALNDLKTPHITFKPYSWLVTREIYKGKTALGVIVEWDGNEIRTDEFTYKVAQTLINFFRDRLNISEMSTGTYGSREVVEAIKNGTPWDEFKLIIDVEIDLFKERRKPYLLY
jgi:uncharacterized protein YbbC (DUF1343 family)